MKVLLRADVRGVGRRGDIVEVKSGFARNYLLPTGQALLATEETERQASSMRRARDLRDAASREAAETQRTVIEQSVAQVAARAGANGHLFGSVTEADIVNALRTATGISLDRKAIHMAEHLKQVGQTTVQVHLFDGVVATLTVDVVAK
jgi:large subunit ribosomal protein L9